MIGNRSAIAAPRLLVPLAALWISLASLTSAAPPAPPIGDGTLLVTPQAQVGEWVSVKLQGGPFEATLVRAFRVTAAKDEPYTKGLVALADGGWAFVGPVGIYRIEAVVCVGGKLTSYEADTEIGEAPQPRPDPIPPPGKRWAVILRESSEQSPELARLVTALRNSEAQRYADEKGHLIAVLDPQAKDPLGRPLPQMPQWLEAAKGHGLPALLVIDPSAGGSGVLSVGDVPDTPSALLEVLRQHGG